MAASFDDQGARRSTRRAARARPPLGEDGTRPARGALGGRPARRLRPDSVTARSRGFKAIR